MEETRFSTGSQCIPLGVNGGGSARWKVIEVNGDGGGVDGEEPSTSRVGVFSVARKVLLVGGEDEASGAISLLNIPVEVTKSGKHRRPTRAWVHRQRLLGTKPGSRIERLGCRIGGGSSRLG